MNKCESCDEPMADVTATYSGNKYGKTLCQDCQKKWDFIIKNSWHESKAKE